MQTPGASAGGDSSVMASETTPEDNGTNYCPFPPRDMSQSVILPALRLMYCARKLKDCPMSMVKQSQTLFIRSSPTAGPLTQPLSSAYAACATYCCRTQDNMHIVKPLIMDTYRQLLLTQVSESIEVELANIQAVLLLHIVQLFDGDTDLRKEAEDGLDKIRDRVLHLQRRAGTGIMNSAAASYETWVLAESIRRTILTSVFAEAIFLSVRDGGCRTVPFMSLLPITVSGRLWAAKSESEWKKGLDLVPSQTMAYGEAIDWWKESGSQGKLEDLQQILFAACKGSPSR